MGRTKQFRLAALVVGIASGLSAHASDWKMDTGVTGRETYTDNVALSATNQKSDFITEVTPYINASKHGARFQADIRYSLQNLFYASDSTKNRINHQLAATSKTELYEKELFLDADASISQQFTSLLGATGNTSNATGNLTDVYAVRVSPYWQHRFGSTANLGARYTHSEITTNTSGLSSSSVDGIEASLASGSAFKTIFWRFDASDQKSNYKSRPDVTISNVSGTLGYEISPKWRVHGTVGYDDNKYNAIGASDLRGRFWSAGFSWAPSPRTSLSAETGHRYYGKTYSFMFDHLARTTSWHAGYTQAVTTTSSQFSLPYGVSTTAYLDGLYKSLIPDPAQRAAFVTQLIMLYGLPPVMTDTYNLLTNAVYLNKRFDASMSYKTPKTVTTLMLYAANQESLESGSTLTNLYGADIFGATNSVQQRGSTVLWLWHLNPRLSANASLSMTRSRFPTLSRTDNLTSLNLGVTRDFSRDVNGNLSVRHQRRDSNVPSGDYDENAIIGTVNYKF